MDTALERKVLCNLAATADAGLVMFMQGLSNDVLSSYNINYPTHMSLSNWVDSNALHRLLTPSQAVYYTKWLTTLLKLAEEGDPDDSKTPFDRLNAALRTTGLYRLGEPLTIYIFEGNYYLAKTSTYEMRYGTQQLAAPRYTTASML